MLNQSMEYLEDAYIRKINELLNLPIAALEAYLNTAKALRENAELLEVTVHCHEKIFHTNQPVMQEAMAVINSAQESVGAYSDMLPVIILGSGVPLMREFYAAHRIPQSILVDTLSDIRVWMNVHYQKNGAWGLSETAWVLNHLWCELFKIGRLQYIHKQWDQPFEVFRNRNTGEVAIYPVGGSVTVSNSGIHSDESNDQPTVSLGDEWEQVLHSTSSVLDLHIQEGEKLSPELCLQSLRAASQLFESAFPEKKFAAFVCSSWLLSPSFRNFLPPTSNIVQFNRLFHLLPLQGSDNQLFDRVFGGKPMDMDKAPRATKLQEAILEQWQNGEDLGEGTGFILKAEV
ncbi:hypothetical protein Back11_08790 [Paenibacillus baekrokdamisoli]|uniref:Uncharacterized protein n=1 Tax=Paenibacillus baekrokdamisoli TaxID=1712516 RepID=A0A3G9J8D3_9BACL|nr:hypothetical protein Back11_08790 [Paenibacillus baekrokdamisoli]